MRAGALIDRLLSATGGHRTRAQLLNDINTTQNIILGTNVGVSRIQQQGLATVDGTLTYEVTPPAGSSQYVRTVSRVYTMAPNYYHGATTDISSNGEPSYDVPFAVTPSSSASYTNATITLEQDPGTTDGTYYVDYYLWPLQLETEDDELTIPDEHIDTVRYKILQYLEEEQYGESRVNKQNAKEALDLFLIQSNSPAKNTSGGYTPSSW